MKNFMNRLFTGILAVLVLPGILGFDSTALGAEPGISGSVTEQKGESEKIAAAYIYHKHIGNSTEGGGCYRQAIYHVHDGDEQRGGDCYQSPVYHEHQGDAENGGPCFGTPIRHEHEGKPDRNGGCYEPVYHQHTDPGCYAIKTEISASCRIIAKTWPPDDPDQVSQGYRYFQMECGAIFLNTDISHIHKVVACGKSKEIVGYALGCGKEEGEVVGYTLDCGKEAGLSIDVYRLSCEKTEETVEGYERNCGKDEETPYGQVTITKSLEEKGRSVLLRASFEPLSDGGIELSEQAFEWYDQGGDLIGTGPEILLYKNGGYSLKLRVENADVREESLTTDIKIEEIEPEKDKDKDPDPGDDSGEGSEENGGGTSGSGSSGGSGEEEGSDPAGEETEENRGAGISPSPSASQRPAKSSALSSHTEDGSSDNSNGGSGLESSAESRQGERNGETTASEETAPSLPAMKPEKQTEAVTLPEVMSEREGTETVKEVQEKKKGSIRQFLEFPTVRAVIQITTGTLLTIAGSLLLIYLLFMSVRVYNDDGEGKMVYLGRCRVKLAEEGYVIAITEAMEEKAVTKRYCIRPGLFRALKGEEEELIVCRRDKKISVLLGREMIAVL